MHPQSTPNQAGSPRPLRALIYDRVSSQAQAQGFSLTTQSSGCQAHCQARGYQVLGEYEDAYTGTTHERPGIQALLAHLEQEPVDVVVAYDLDRLLGRDEMGQILVRMGIVAHCRIEYVVGGGHDQESQDGDLHMGFKALVARWENAQRTERSKRGQRGRVEAGFPIISGNGAPYGYTYVAGRKSGELVICEEEALTVRQMFHWLVVDGLSSHRIAQKLAEMGVPTRGDGRRQAGESVRKHSGHGVWNPATVKKILRSPVYRGEYLYGTTKRVRRPSMLKADGSRYSTRYVQVPTEPSQWLSAPVPAIVDLDTWNRAQAQLDHNKRYARPASHQYLLRGLLICPSCGSRWCGSPGSGSNVYYKCPNASGHAWKPQCAAGFFVRQDEVEPVVWGYVLEQLLSPADMLAMVEARQQQQAGERARAGKSIQHLEQEMAEIDRKLGALLEQALEGFPKEVISAKRTELLDTRGRLEKERERLAREQAVATVGPQTVQMLQELASRIREVEPRMTFEERCSLLRSLQIEVDVLDRGRIQVRGLVDAKVLSTLSGQHTQHLTQPLPFWATLSLPS